MNRKLTPIFIAMILVFSSFTFIKVNQIAVGDEPSDSEGYEIIGDSVIWENQYGRLEVYPHTSQGLIQQVQYANMTWKYPDNYVDIAFRFASPIGNPDIWMWQNISHDVSVSDYGYVSADYTLYNISDIETITESEANGYGLDFGDIPSAYYRRGNASYWEELEGWIEGTFVIGFDSVDWLNPEHTNATFYYEYWGITGDHIEGRYWFDWGNIKHLFSYQEYNDKHYYYVSNIPVIQNKSYLLKWQYDVPLNSNGKWELLGKLHSDTIQEALSSGRYVMIDPWWDSGWSYFKTCTVSNKWDDYAMPLIVAQDSSGDVDCGGHCQDDFGDIRFVNSNNDTEVPYWMENYTSGERAYFWVNNSCDENVINMYYGTSGTSTTTSSGADTFWLFDDFSGADYDPAIWDETGTVVYSGGFGQFANGDALATDATYGIYYQVRAECTVVSIVGNGWCSGGFGLYYIDPSSTIYNYKNGGDLQGMVSQLGGVAVGLTEAYEMQVWHIMRRNNTDTEFQAQSASVQGARVTNTNVETDPISVTLGTRPGYTESMNVDWVFLSPCRFPEPKFTAFSSEQTPPAGNVAPANTNPSPSDASTGVELTPMLEVTVTDSDSTHVNTTWMSNSSGAWVSFAQNLSVVAGSTIRQNNSNLSASITTYYWSVNTSDGCGGWDNDTYRFTTKDTPDVTSPTGLTASNPTTVSIDLNWTKGEKGKDGTLRDDNNSYVIVGASKSPFYDLQQPASVYRNNVTYVVYKGLTGDPYAISYNHTTGIWSDPVYIGNNPLVDDNHGAPAMVMNYSGYCYVFYGAHLGEASGFIMNKTTNPYDISSWETGTTIGTGGTYPFPVVLNNGSILFIHRLYEGPTSNNDYPLWYRLEWENDFGTAHKLVDYGGANAGSMYPHSARVSSDGTKVFFTYVWKDIGDLKRKNIYVAYINTTDWNVYNMSGTNLGASIDSTESEDNCKIFDSGDKQIISLYMDIDSSDNPHLSFSHNNAFKYMNWTGTSWSNTTTVTTDLTTDWNPFKIIINGENDIDGYLITSPDVPPAVGGDLEKWHYDGYTWSRECWVMNDSDAPHPIDYIAIPRNHSDEIEILFAEVDNNNYDTDVRAWAYGENGFIGDPPVFTNVRYSASDNLTTYTDGSLAYNGTGSDTTKTGLSSSTTYYFRAWSFLPGDGWNATGSNAESQATSTPNTAPTQSGEIPANQSTGIGLTPICNITVTDIDGDAMTVNISSNSTGSWQLEQTNSSVASGTSVEWNKYANATSCSTRYYWRVNVSDGQGGYSEETYYFTTIADTITFNFISMAPSDILINSTGKLLITYNVTTTSTGLNQTSLFIAHVLNNTRTAHLNNTYTLYAENWVPNKKCAINRNYPYWFESEFSYLSGDDTIGDIGEWAVHNETLYENITINSQGSNWINFTHNITILENLFGNIFLVNREAQTIEDKTGQTFDVYKDVATRVIFNMSDTQWWSDAEYNNTYYTLHFYAEPVSPDKDLLVYFANNSYTSGNPLTSEYCELIGTVTTTQSYDYTVRNSSYYDISFSSDENGTIGSVGMTDNFSFIFASNAKDSTHKWIVYYADDNITIIDEYHDFKNSSSSMTCTDKGVTWLNQDGTIDTFLSYGHLDNIDRIMYKVYCQMNGTATGDGSWSSTIIDVLDETNLPPNTPNVITPNGTITDYTIGTVINVTYSWLGDPNLDTCWLNITAINETDVIVHYLQNRSITSAEYEINNTWWYDWNTTGLSPGGVYHINITATDLDGASSWGVQDGTFNLSTANTPPTSEVVSPLNSSTGIEIQPTCQIWANDTDGDTLTVNWYENSTQAGYQGWSIDSIITTLPDAHLSEMGMDVDSNNIPHIAWSSATGSTEIPIYYAYRDSTGDWRGQINTTEPDIIGFASWVRGIGLDIDSSDGIHIVFYNGTSDYLEYVTWNATGSTWDSDNVLPSTVTDTAIKTIATDSSDRPHVIYVNSSGLMYAYYDGSKWRGQSDSDKPDVAWVDSAMEYYSLAVNNSDIPHISHVGDNTEGINQQVNHTWWNGASWQSELVWTQYYATSGADTCIDINGDDQPVIVFLDTIIGDDGCRMYYCWKNETGWYNESYMEGYRDYPFVRIDRTTNISWVISGAHGDVIKVFKRENEIWTNITISDGVITSASHMSIAIMPNGSLCSIHKNNSVLFPIYSVNYSIQDWVLRQTNSSFTANTIASWDYTQADSYSTKYWWKVNISDGQGGYSEETYYFTTTEIAIDAEISPDTWVSGNVGVNTYIQKNFTFWQNGSATLDITIGLNSTNFTFVNYNSWLNLGHDRYCANFTVDSWASENTIEPGYPPSTVLKSSFAPGSFTFGVRIWMPRTVTYFDVQEDFEIVLVVSESS